MSNITRATLALGNEGIPYTLHAYEYEPGAERVGLQAALDLGVDPALVLKTLMLKAGRQAICVLVPADREVQLKPLAALLGVKSVEMMKPADAERVSGYHVGGISPFGQKRRLRCFLDASAEAHAEIVVNGGRRGLQIALAPADLATALEAVVCPLQAE